MAHSPMKSYHLFVTDEQPMTKHNSTRSIAAIVLAAGMGTRMKSDLPKVMHKIAGRPMITHVLSSVGELSPDLVVVVVGPHMDSVRQTVKPAITAVQEKPLGTGHAIASALEDLKDFGGDVLILFGADPLIRPDTMQRLLDTLKNGVVVAVLGFCPDDPGAYGRLIVTGDGKLSAIVEARDATPEQLQIPICNSGVMAVNGALLPELIKLIKNDNAKGEYYLTDIVGLAQGAGHKCAWIEGDADELIGVDSRADLAQAEAIVQNRFRKRAMDNGATLIAPETVFFSHDTTLGHDVVVEPNVVFGAGVKINDSVTVHSFSHIEGATIDQGATIGPYARLRPGADVGENAKIGNFVEIKNARLDAGAKVSHLSYIGDAYIGVDANIGAGTITCNYDGFSKSKTTIGAGAFIGSNTALVAPVTVGDRAIIGAGSVIAKNVDIDALAVTRAPQKSVHGWAEKFRKKQTLKKKD